MRQRTFMIVVAVLLGLIGCLRAPLLGQDDVRRLPAVVEPDRDQDLDRQRKTVFDAREFEITLLQSLGQLGLQQRSQAKPTALAAESAEQSQRQRVKDIPVDEPAETVFQTNPKYPQTPFRFELDAYQPFSARLAAAERQDPEATAYGALFQSASAKGNQQAETQSCPTACDQTFHHHSDFSPAPLIQGSYYHDGGREAWVYDTKNDVPTQRPWVEWGRPWYGDGITPRGIDLFGPYNLVRPKFYVYGDLRTGIQAGRNAGGRADNWASRLNLDFDFQITDSDRLHTFVIPNEDNARFSRWQLVNGDLQFRNEVDFTPLTAFYEGDLGVILGALSGQSSPFEFPFTAGLVPLLFQNGIWMEDAVTGVSFAIPARHSRALNWANFDVNFFAVFDQLNSPAFANDSDAQAFGTAWFIEAYGGYIESGYAFLRHRNDDRFSYHNATVSFTRRYLNRFNNSVRVIINAGQDLAKSARTADGGLLIVENSLITAAPLTFVPYANFFYGWNRPQSVARAGLSGGILRNTGINFDTDGVNGFPILDPTAADTAGFTVGVDLIGDNLDRQLLLEFAYLSPHGDRAIAQGDQFGVGARYQFPISNATLLRFDTMYGWRGNEEDVYGTRMEYRWKF